MNKKTSLTAQELRLGNILLFDEMRVRVKGMSQDFNDSPYDIEIELPDGMFTQVPLEDLRPIALTHEIVLESGFERSSFVVGDGWKIKIDGRNLYFTDEMEFYVEDESIAFMTKRVDYLHTLQNLIFSLTGTELK